jgi:hypothetical protein
MHKKILRISFALILTWPLMACEYLAGEPNQEQVAQLVKESIATQMRNSTGDNPIAKAFSKAFGIDQVTFNKIEKISCKLDDQKVHTCLIYVDFDIGTPDQNQADNDLSSAFKFHERVQKTMPFKFYKSASGWVNVN